MAIAEGDITTMLQDVRLWINDRNVNPIYDNDRLLRMIARSYDTIIEEVFTSPLDKPFCDFILPLKSNKREYILPTGIGHVYELAILEHNTDTTSPIVLQHSVRATIPTFHQNDVRGEGWRWNPPILRFDTAPSNDLDLLVTFIPRAIEYLHLGQIADYRDVTFSNSFLISLSSGSSGTFKLRYDGQDTGTIAVNASSAALETALEALSNIANVTVTGDAGGPWTVVFVSPSGYVRPIEVHTKPTDGTVTVAPLYSTTYPEITETTLRLDAAPIIGLFDPRVNAFIGGRLRVLTGDTPLGYTHFPWQERDIIEYDPATHNLTLSAPFDFVLGSGESTYEILPRTEQSMLHTAAMDLALTILSMSGNDDRVRIVSRERDRQLATCRKLLSTRNRAKPIMPTPKRYLKAAGLSSDAAVFSVLSGTQNGLDRFLV